MGSGVGYGGRGESRVEGRVKVLADRVEGEMVRVEAVRKVERGGTEN